MKVYLYHTQDIQRIVREWGQGVFPGHFLYGATQLGDYGIEVIYHRHKPILKRWLLMIYNTWRILSCRTHFDAVYAIHYRGIEPVIFMRALGLFRRPVVIWHHQPMTGGCQSVLRRLAGRLFYKGIDRMFFFSEKLLNDSLLSPNARPERMHIGHWGPDLDFFERLRREHPAGTRSGFISTGKERRDMVTLVTAFNAAGAPLDIYLPVESQGRSLCYRTVLGSLSINDNIRVHYVSGLIPFELSCIVNRAACVVISVEETQYTVGLTTLVEALGLGLPIVCSRNPQYPFDVEKEGCGICVPYYDVEGWRQAVCYITEHPDEAARMGRRAREMAEIYNDRVCAREVAEVIRAAVG